MNQQKMVLDNYKKTNMISAKCMRIVSVILLLGFIYCMVFSDIDQMLLIIFFGSAIFVTLLPTLLINVFKFDTQKIISVIVIFCITITATVMLTLLSVHVYAIMLFPILVASLYYNQTLVLFASLLMSCGIAVSNLVDFKYRNVFVAYPADNFDTMIMEYVVPQILVVFALSVVSYFIVQRNSMTLNAAIDTSLTMQSNQKGLVYALSEISESKSRFTGEHIKRVAEYMRVLGRASNFDEEYIELLSTAAMAHDIGKLMISEDILEKTGKLTDEEYQIMKSHVLYGEALLDKCPGQLMHIACILAKEHHEKWDGTGYLGMKGEEISYIARLISVCDVFDALTANRSYKKGWSLEDAHDEIVRQSGKSFDPKVVRLFIKHFDEFKAIHERIPDKDKY